MTFKHNDIIQVDGEELTELLQFRKEDYIIIDVREREEYAEAHIPGVPLIPMNTIPTLIEQLDKKSTYLFICQGGGRSQAVCEFMKENGFPHVRNYAGGMMTWTGETKEGLEWVVENGDELLKDQK